MRVAEWINVFFFLFFIALAWRLPTGRRRARVTSIGIVGLGLILAAQFIPGFLPPRAVSVIRDWLPAPLWLMMYWQAGRFFTQPREEFQSRLALFDRKLLEAFWRWLAGGRSRAWILTYFELAYLLYYPVVPSALCFLYLFQMERYADRLWAAVLLPAYLCFSVFPFWQTLPPRMLDEHWESNLGSTKIRALNLWVLQHASIQANIFPSAHVAASVATALVLLSLLPWVGLAFLWISISIALGAVTGRYHYALDALLGAGLAVGVFLIETLFWYQ